MKPTPVSVFRSPARLAPAGSAPLSRALSLSPLLLGLAWLLASQTVLAAGNTSTAQQRYEKERALCLSGKSQQDRQTCLKEAAAARSEAARGGLTDPMVAFQKEALQRCKALPVAEQKACEAAIPGKGPAAGVVERGGIYVQTTPAEAPAPAASPAASAPSS